MPHIFHMNIERYTSTNLTVGGMPSAKHTSLRNAMLAYMAAGGGRPAVDVAGFTEISAAPGTIAANLYNGILDLGLALAVPAAGGMPNRHCLVVNCGETALQYTDYLGIVINGNATLNGWGRVYIGNMGYNYISHDAFPVVGGVNQNIRHDPPNGSTDYRCIVYVDYTLAMVTRRIGFVHNMHSFKDNRAFFMQRINALLQAGGIQLCGGDFNVEPHQDRVDRNPMYFYDTGAPTTAGGNNYDWFCSGLLYPPPGGPPPPKALTSATPLPAGVAGSPPGSDHMGVGIYI